MDNAQKAIMLGVGLFITIIVIAAVMAITGIGQDLIGQSQGQLAGISSQLASQVQSAYDQVKLTGSQVRTAIQKYYNEEGLTVYLVSELATTANPISNFKSDVLKSGIVESGTYAAPYICTPNLIDMANISSANVTISPDGVSSAMNITGVTVNNGYLKAVDTASRTALATLTGKIQANGRYKSVLIVNQATSEIMGILITRYQ